MKNPYLYTDMSLKHVFILSLLWVTPSLTRMFAADETPVATDTIFFDDGSWYLGQVSDSLFNGYGKMVYPDSTVYEGEWKDGMWDGKGEIFYSDGDHYKGDFREHEFSGEGVYEYSNGARYEGNWEHNMFNGAGTLNYADGSLYAGNWKDDLKDGVGVLYDVSSGELYKGYFSNDEYVGAEPSATPQENREQEQFHNDIFQEQREMSDEPLLRNNPSPLEIYPTYGQHYLLRRPDDSFHLRNDIVFGISFSTGKVFGIDLDYYLTDHFFTGLSIGINVKDPSKGEAASYIDEETNSRVTLIEWNELPFEINEEISLKRFSVSADAGYSWKWFTLGTSVGIGFSEKIRNCTSTRQNPEFLPGTDYFRESPGSDVFFNYKAFTDFIFLKNRGDLHYASVRLGYGNFSGIFMGLAISF